MRHYWASGVIMESILGTVVIKRECLLVPGVIMEKLFLMALIVAT